MAGKTRKSSLLGKSLKAHAQDETDYGREFIDLPGGISGGIAQLIDAKIGEYKSGENQGKQFLYMAGAVMEPRTAVKTTKVFQDGKTKVVASQEIEIQGQRTSYMEPLCNTKKRDGTVVTLDEHVQIAMNAIRMVGGEECTEDISSDADLEKVLAELVEEGPFFKFSTSQGDPTADYPEPRVWENWHGAKDLEDYEVPEDDDVEEDDPEETEEEEEEDEVETEEETEEDEEGDEDEEEEEDLASLVEVADGDDEDAAQDAQSKMGELAAAVGISEDDANEMPTWQGLADAIEAASEEDEEDEEDEDEDEDEEEEEKEPPQKEECYQYKPPKKKKAVEVIVTAVFKTKKTCNLKDLSTNAVYKAVPWDKLIENE